MINIINIIKRKYVQQKRKYVHTVMGKIILQKEVCAHILPFVKSTSKHQDIQVKNCHILPWVNIIEAFSCNATYPVG